MSAEGIAEVAEAISGTLSRFRRKQRASFLQAAAITAETNSRSPPKAHFCPSEGPTQNSNFLKPQILLLMKLESRLLRN